jgi:hypothetical protein
MVKEEPDYLMQLNSTYGMHEQVCKFLGCLLALCVVELGLEIILALIKRQN